VVPLSVVLGTFGVRVVLHAAVKTTRVKINKSIRKIFLFFTLSSPLFLQFYYLLFFNFYAGKNTHRTEKFKSILYRSLPQKNQISHALLLFRQPDVKLRVRQVKHTVYLSRRLMMKAAFFTAVSVISGILSIFIVIYMVSLLWDGTSLRRLRRLGTAVCVCQIVKAAFFFLSKKKGRRFGEYHRP
jgi:hypothetical protein